MFGKVLKWLESHGRKRIVYDRVDNAPYLERYYLFIKDRDSFPFNVFLHKFLKSDIDDVHDHPWPYATLILRGGYYEYVPILDQQGKILEMQCSWRGPGHFRICKSTSLHRIELKPNVDCWTLFMPGPKQREWGFIKNNKWMQWQRYLAHRKTESDTQAI